ncbi:mCG144809, partial [Mus musculus]
SDVTAIMSTAPRCGRNPAISWKYMCQKPISPSGHHQTYQTQRQSHSPRITQWRTSSGWGLQFWSLCFLAFFCSKLSTAKGRPNMQLGEKAVLLSWWQTPGNKSKDLRWFWKKTSGTTIGNHFQRTFRKKT